MMKEWQVRNMLQELMEIAKHVQIDEVASTRLEACMDSEFESSPIRCFITRKAIIVAATGAPLSIRISGFGESFEGSQLTCSNTDNPENLEVSMKDCETRIVRRIFILFFAFQHHQRNHGRIGMRKRKMHYTLVQSLGNSAG